MNHLANDVVKSVLPPPPHLKNELAKIPRGGANVWHRGAEDALIGWEVTLEPTAGVDEDFDRTVVSVLVRQGDDDTGGRAGQRVCISADGVRRALHTYTGQ